MRKKQLTLFSIYIFLFLLNIFHFSCNTVEKKEYSQKEIETIANAFFKKLSIEQKDSTLQIIKDSIKNEAIRKEVFRKILEYGCFFLDEATYSSYLHSFQPQIAKEDYLTLGYVEAYNGIHYQRTGKIDSAFLLVKKGIETIKKAPQIDSARLATIYFNLALMYYREQYNISSTEAGLTAMKYIPQNAAAQKDSGILSLKFDIKSHLVVCYEKQKGSEKTSKGLMKELIREAKNDSSFLFALYYSLATIYARLEQKDSALWAYKKGDEIYKTLPEVIKQVNPRSYTNEYWIYRKCKDNEKALLIAEEGKRIADSLGDRNESMKLSYSLAGVHLALGNLEKAQFYYNILAEDKDFARQKMLLSAFNDSLLTLNLKKANNQLALSYFYKSKKLRDSLTEKESKQVLADMNVRYQTEEKEDKIRQLLLAQKTAQIRNLILLLIFILALGISAWVIYRNRQKRLLLESHQELLKVKNKLQAQELENHKTQLANFTESISTKNKLIENMELQLDELIQNASCIAKEESNKNKETLEAMKILTNDDWQMYLDYFEKAHPNFLRKINILYYDLTQGELRVFLLIRQGLNRDKIAQTLGISHDGVRKNFYRLRKKMNAEDDNHLVHLILSIKDDES